jgi:hypothetical protein
VGHHVHAHRIERVAGGLDPDDRRPGRGEGGELALEPAVDRVADAGIDRRREPARGGHRRDGDDEVEPGVAQDVGVRRRVDAAVDVLPPVDHDGGEVAGDGARGGHALGEPGPRGSRPAEDDAPPVVAARRAHPEVVRPVAGADLVEDARVAAEVDLARRHHRRGEDTGAQRPRPAGDAGEQASRRGAPPAQPEGEAERGELRRVAVEPGRGVAALHRQRGRHRPRREVMRGDAEAEQRPCHRPRRRADDDVCRPGIPAEVVLERGEHAGVVGLADGATGTEHESDAHLRRPLPIAGRRRGVRARLGRTIPRHLGPHTWTPRVAHPQVWKPCPVFRPSSPRATFSRSSAGGAKRSPSVVSRCSAIASRTSRPTRSVRRSGPMGWR